MNKKAKIGNPCESNANCLNKNCVNNVCTRKTKNRARSIHKKRKLNEPCLTNEDCANKNCLNQICTRKRKGQTDTSEYFPVAVKAKKTKNKRAPKKAKANERIQRFMLQKRHAIKAAYLKNVCSNSGLCIAFGQEIQKIKQFFNYFVHFDYVKSVVSLNEPSNNASVLNILYSHRGYESHAILKLSQEKSADNLWYEYKVGQVVNQWSKFFPCFIETYGLFEVRNRTSWDKYISNILQFQDVSEPLKDHLSLVQKDPDIGTICKRPTDFCLLIQHIQASTMWQVYSSLRMDTIELLCILAQIYFPLGQLFGQFAHNDLHMDNVMLFRPSPGKYVHFLYYFSADEPPVQFVSPYIAKMIDYGRSFIQPSEAIKKDVCAERLCKPNCGIKSGFTFLPLAESKYYFSASEYNPSHDLRLFYSVLPDFVRYGVGIEYPDPKDYGTKPNFNPIEGKRAANVLGASILLKKSLFALNYQANQNDPLIYGELHVYLDQSRPARFVKKIL